MTIQATSDIRDNTSVFLTSDALTAEFAGDVNGSVAAMMLLHARETREMAGQARNEEEKNLVEQENEQVQRMRDKADDIRMSGALQGVTMMIGGGLEVAAGYVTMTGSTFTEGNHKGELMPGPSGSSDALSGAGHVIQAGGKLGSALADGNGADADTDATAAGNRAEQSRRRLEDIKDMESDARDLARAAIDFYRGVTQTKADGDRAAVFLRG